MFLPEKDVHSASKQKLESQLSSLYGGRIAEELIYGDEKVTTGASNDIERATELATNMVTQWGLSKKLGPLDYSHAQGQPSFFGSAPPSNVISEDISKQIDEEIRELIERNYNRALNILNENMAILHAMTSALMRYETIDKDQIDTLMSGNVV
jgi:cell division protease FtsH